MSFYPQKIKKKNKKKWKIPFKYFIMKVNMMTHDTS